MKFARTLINVFLPGMLIGLLSSAAGCAGSKPQVVQPSEGIPYYSEALQEWRSDSGPCKTCTIQNGYGSEGIVGKIAWRELWLSLRNDANEAPPIDEVRDLFASQYAADATRYPVQVQRFGDQFLIYVAVPKELKDRDFLEHRGALVATYEIKEAPIEALRTRLNR